MDNVGITYNANFNSGYTYVPNTSPYMITTSTTAGGYGFGAIPASPKPDDNLTWLRKQVEEVCADARIAA